MGRGDAAPGTWRVARLATDQMTDPAVVDRPWGWATQLWARRQVTIALLAVVAIGLHLLLRFAVVTAEAAYLAPLWVALALGGMPLVAELLLKAFRREFGSDLLAGISIVTAILLDEYLAGTLVVLMLSGGEALESYAVRRASGVLQALARRMPQTAHRRRDGDLEDVPLDEIRVGDLLTVFPHEICPVDGVVVEGRGTMDESYLTGEPYIISKTVGTAVLSGAINGETALTIRAQRRAVDSRYAQIMRVMRESQQRRPRLRRLGDQLGAYYTPLALAIALAAWGASGEAIRFLAVLVVATPCPLLIAIPVSIIGSVSLAAQRGIIVRDPLALEKIDTVRTVIFDKTGTLTYGRPRLTEELVEEPRTRDEVLAWVASLERYSKHPLAAAILEAARRRRLELREAVEVREPPGQGLTGDVAGQQIRITSRKHLAKARPELAARLPEEQAGMECVILIDNDYAATYRFRDEPRVEGAPFVNHLTPRHGVDRILLVSGDRESEVRYLADRVGIAKVYASQSPEQKVAIVRRESGRQNTAFLGDGINDAPALMQATVGIAIGSYSDVTTEAAGAVIMDSSLQRADEFFHIGQRMRRIALQSAVGGMGASIVGMFFASLGYLPPVAGAVVQEIIDVAAVLNALRAAWPPGGALSDIELSQRAGASGNGHSRPPGDPPR